MINPYILWKKKGMEKKETWFPIKIITCSHQSIESLDLPQTPSASPVFGRRQPRRPQSAATHACGWDETKYGDTGDAWERGMPILWTDFEEYNSHNAVASSSESLRSLSMLCWKRWKRWARDMGACCPHWHLSSACPAAGMCHAYGNNSSQPAAKKCEQYLKRFGLGWSYPHV